MRLSALFAAAVCALVAAPALASTCFQLAQGGPRAVPAALSLAPDEVGLRFLGHAAFRITTPQGISAVTDFSGFWGPGDPPDVATMNKAHITHWTPSPDPRIRHVLRGWNPDGGEAMHDLALGDMIVRNVPTDIRSWDGVVEPLANSIFVFEVADLCIGHLGHLHHKPTEIQYGMIGRLDVVMAPVDGGYTMNLPAMISVLKRLRARVVIPMHWFGPANLERFLAGMADDFAIRRVGAAEIAVSAARLPDRPTVMVLDGR